MHYVRFLKTPKVFAKDGTVVLKATVTITTDLGETYYPRDVALAATLRSSDPNGDVYLRRSFEWTDGTRALPLSFDITRTEIEWPARLHVGLKSGIGYLTDHLESFNEYGDTPSIISAWSDDINATGGYLESSRQVERQFMPLTRRPLHIFEDTGESIARHLWDGSLALTAYIDQVVALQAETSMPLLERALITATYKKLNVIELGCGCGVVGIALSQTVPDCDVLLTDLPEVDELVARNIEAASPAMSSHIEFAALDWDAPLPSAVQSRNFDIIVAAECIYNTDSIPPLVKTLTALVQRSPKAVVVISTKFRHDSERLFHDLAAKAGLIESSSAKLPLPGEPGHGYGDFSTHVDLHILHGKHYKSTFSPDGLDKAFDLSSGSE
ncbi:hypothetical protein MBLNU457_1981t1 [Dothideomycetes sp. NU457]